MAPDNTLAIAFLNATAAQTPGGLDALIAREENRLETDPHGYTTQLRLGFSYLFASTAGRERAADAREAFAAAAAAAPDAAGAHVGLGILRMNEHGAGTAPRSSFWPRSTAIRATCSRANISPRFIRSTSSDPQRGLSYADRGAERRAGVRRHRFPHRLAAAWI